MPSYLTSVLIQSIKNRVLIPLNQSTFTAANILSLADEELSTYIVPAIMSVREEYFVTSKAFTISDAATAAGYSIPTRAVGAVLRDLTIATAVGQPEVSVPIIPVDQVASTNGYYSNFNQNNPVAYIKGNRVYLTPPTGNSGQLIMYFFQRRSNLVEANKAGRVDAIDTTAKTVTLGNVPTAFTDSVTYDFVQAQPNFETLSLDITPTDVSSSVFTFSELPADLAVGDYLCLAGETPVPQVPVEYHAILAQRTAVQILMSIGDQNNLPKAEQKLLELQAAVLGMISPRVEGEAKKITNPNSPLNIGNRYNKFTR